MTNSIRSKCPLCQKSRVQTAFIDSSNLHPAVQHILSEKIGSSQNRRICLYCVQDVRRVYLDELLRKEKLSMGALEAEVIRSLQAGQSISENLNVVVDEDLSYGQHLADTIASFGGSWTFIVSFALCLAIWILISSFQKESSFDPYPFILLNLILSCLAALQAPIIMMSQNRQEAKDRIRSEHDYQVNLKAELEIRELHMKVDQLMTHHWEGLLEIQQAQIEILNEQTKVLLEARDRS